MRKLFLLFAVIPGYCAQSQDIDVLHYNYNIQLSDISDTIRGTAIITFVQNSDAHKASFDLAGINDKGKGMRLLSAHVGTHNASFVQRNDSVVVELAKGRRGDTVKLWLKYKGVPSDGLIISKNKFGDRTFFADNWPNRAHFWIPCKDVVADKASFEFTVTAPAHYRVISNGTKVEERDLPGAFRLTHWKEDTPLPTKVMVIGVANFSVTKYPGRPSGVPVSAWIYRQDSAEGVHDYAAAPEIVKFFSDYIAPYPYKKLANVQSTTIFGGMENASAIFYTENSVTGRGGVDDLLAHEIAHQWFGDMASEKSFTHLWLSEGFATYFTDIYWQHKYGEEAFQTRLKNERDQVVRFVATHSQAVVDSLTPYMELLNANSYQKGAWVLHMLRNEVGDSVFRKIIRNYYHKYKGANGDTRDFEAVAENTSGKNLKWFFDQWLYRPGIPKLVIEKKIDGDDVKLRITQQGVKYKFPLDVAFVRADGSWLKQTIPVDDQMTEYKIKVPDVRSVVIDPDVKLLFADVR